MGVEERRETSQNPIVVKEIEIKEVSLMDEEMIDELRQEIKRDVGKWEEALLKWAYKVGRQVAVVLLEEMDDELMRGREGGLGVEGFRGRWVTGVLGTCGSSGGCIGE